MDASAKKTSLRTNPCGRCVLTAKDAEANRTDATILELEDLGAGVFYGG